MTAAVLLIGILLGAACAYGFMRLQSQIAVLSAANADNAKRDDQIKRHEALIAELIDTTRAVDRDCATLCNKTNTRRYSQKD